jgi:hypothetical protein
LSSPPHPVRHPRTTSSHAPRVRPWSRSTPARWTLRVRAGSLLSVAHPPTPITPSPSSLRSPSTAHSPSASSSPLAAFRPITSSRCACSSPRHNPARALVHLSAFRTEPSSLHPLRSCLPSTLPSPPHQFDAVAVESLAAHLPRP